MSQGLYDVVTVGHILLDLRFCVDRFATPDRESAIVSQSHGVGGSAANVAIGVRRLGGRSTVIGKVGFDDFGKNALEDLVREGVDVSNVKIQATNGRTGFTIVVIDATGQILMYGFKGVAEELLPEEVNTNIFDRARAVHIASLRLDTATHAARAAREKGVFVSWDPGRVQARLGLEKLRPIISLADLVLPNEVEAREITGEEDVRRAADVLHEAGARIVVVKRGSRGVYVSTRDEEFEVPAYLPGKVVDTTGAGDALAAGILVGLRRFPLREAVRFATVVAGIKVTRLGSHEIPSMQEVEAELKKIGFSTKE
ncbi:carbohydrate kinase family protein [Infirmifilum lucidum]|uniref:Carbohydrate kinase family protein n=1 Tax=Infirmifilum lucidum TaxID=2776706 RepID=A0A7L9FIY6_9CREN|nr:carbohydrate kinase family protein [Infirmifilum lucidum]QOJ78755.1 carbohydrate kinase family protein [Infirmifilum lucidum]